MDVKLTPEWCEQQAQRFSMFADTKHHDAYLLAARALRAREWLVKQSTSGCDANEPGCVGGCAIVHAVEPLAILNGEPMP